MLIDNLKDSIEDYFTKKTSNFNFYGSTQTEDRVNSISDEAVEMIFEILDSADNEIDRVLEDFDSEEERAREISNIMDDMRTQDYLERSLGL